MDEEMKAGQFKTECLKVMDRVKKTRRRIIITKRNVPVVKIVPIDEKEEDSLGKMKGSLLIKGDIIGPINEIWNADS